MKKKQLMELVVELAKLNRDLQSQILVQTESDGDSKKLDLIINKVGNLKNEITSLKKENEKLKLLLKEVSRSHKVLLDKVGRTQEEVTALAKEIGRLDCMNHNYDSSDSNSTVAEEEASTKIKVYTDSGMDSTTKCCGYGYVVVERDGAAFEANGAVDKPSGIEEMTIQLGEAYGIVKALEAVKCQDCSEVEVYTDNNTAVSWACMGTRPSNEVGRWFYERLQEFKDCMDISIVWMKRCSCDYNVRADELAKLAMAEHSFVMVQEYFEREC